MILITFLPRVSIALQTLDATELEGDGVVLSLEEQLNALSLSTGTPSSSGPGSEDTVSLNGSRFPSCLFEDPSKSTKVCSAHHSADPKLAVNSEKSH